jgi:hypothetical protein
MALYRIAFLSDDSDIADGRIYFGMQVRQGIVIVLLVCLGGCFPREDPKIGAVEPSANIAGMEKAARQKDRSAVPALVAQLDDSDPAIRFYTIEALRSITGQTLDYRYYDEVEQRAPAIQRWKDWLARQSATASR